MKAFNGVREATIQFSDVFSSIPITSDSTDVTTDFDAVLTAQVRNTGRWQDMHFPTGTWPALGDYGAVLADQLRTQQIEEVTKLGIELGDSAPTDIHPDIAVMAYSLQKTLVVVVNCAPRRSDHHEKSINGDEFYVGITKSGIEVYAQLPYFRGLHARGRLTALYRIPNDGGVWPVGEQFRSSVVSQARRYQDVLQKASLDLIPPITMAGRVAYADKFGNVRLEMADSKDTMSKLKPGTTVALQIGAAARLDNVHVVTRLTEIPEGELGIYYNPADPNVAAEPHYVELVRRVSNPNTNPTHAFATLIQCLNLQDERFFPTIWDETEITIVTT